MSHILYAAQLHNIQKSRQYDTTKGCTYCQWPFFRRQTKARTKQKYVIKFYRLRLVKIIASYFSHNIPFGYRCWLCVCFATYLLENEWPYVRECCMFFGDFSIYSIVFCVGFVLCNFVCNKFSASRIVQHLISTERNREREERR